MVQVAASLTPGPPDSRKAVRERENAEAIGGMRCPAKAVGKLPYSRQAGREIEGVLNRAIAQDPSIVAVILQCLDGHPTKGFDPASVARARTAVREAWGRAQDGPDPPGLQPDILCEYCQRAHDIVWILAEWLVRGAPLGITTPVKPTGVFPPVAPPDRQAQGIEEIVTDPSGLENYRSAEDDPVPCKQLLTHMVEQQWAVSVVSWEELCTLLRSKDITLNKLGLVTKIREDGTTKYRLVWDLRRSGVNEHVHQGERVILPRLQDVVEDILYLLNLCEEGESVWLMVVDITDAFHLIPLQPDERRFTAAEFQGRFYAFSVLVFGSASAPTVWGRYAAWLGRSTSAIVDPRRVRLQVYVDDPCYSARGTRLTAARALAVALLWAAVCGFPISWPKARGGKTVPWIGASLTACADGATVEIPEKKAQELAQDCEEVLQHPTATRRKVRQVAGKAAFVAGLVITLRPFLACLWAAIAGRPDPAADCDAPVAPDGPSGSGRDRSLPAALVFTRQAAHGLRWLRAFFAGQRGAISRHYSLRGPALGETFHICTDASPWGIGGGAVARLDSSRMLGRQPTGRGPR